MEFFDIGAGAVTLVAMIITLVVIIITLVVIIVTLVAIIVTPIVIIVTLVVIMVTNSKGWLCLETLASTFLSLRSQNRKLLLSCCDVTKHYLTESRQYLRKKIKSMRTCERERRRGLREDGILPSTCSQFCQ